jgi:hypothetical protein
LVWLVTETGVKETHDINDGGWMMDWQQDYVLTTKRQMLQAQHGRLQEREEKFILEKSEITVCDRQEKLETLFFFAKSIERIRII